MSKKKFKRLYIYCYEGDEENSKVDVAITEAFSETQAIQKFKEYYKIVEKENIQLLNLYRKNYGQNIQIITKY